MRLLSTEDKVIWQMHVPFNDLCYLGYIVGLCLWARVAFGRI